MTKAKRKNAKTAISAQRVGESKAEAAEYVRYLLSLHKLQGTLLNRLESEVR